MSKKDIKSVARFSGNVELPMIGRIGNGRIITMTSKGKKSDNPHKEFTVKFKDNVISAVLIDTWHKINSKDKSKFRNKGWLVFGPGKNNICYLTEEEFNEFFSIVE